MATSENRPMPRAPEGEFVMSSERRRPALVFAVVLAVLLLPRAFARAFDVVLNAQGEFIDAYPANPDSITGTPPRVGRHVNGQLCFFPRGFGHDGQFVVADDTYRESCLDRNPPEARCTVTDRGSPFYI